MCFDYDYDECPEFCDSTIHLARKAHSCTACGGTIEPGEHYERQSGKFDGHFYVDKVCRRCCYDIVRVVEHELAEGCNWSEAWPAVGDLVGYLVDSGLGQTRPEDVPAEFRVGDQPRMPVPEPSA